MKYFEDHSESCGFPNYEAFFLWKLGCAPNRAFQITAFRKVGGCNGQCDCPAFVICKWAIILTDKWRELRPNKLALRGWIRVQAVEFPGNERLAGIWSETLPQYVKHLDWVLVGGESRDSEPAKARIMQPARVKEIKKIRDSANVPFFFNKWGSQKPVAVNPDQSIKFEPMDRHYAGNVFLNKLWHPWPVPKIGKPRNDGIAA